MIQIIRMFWGDVYAMDNYYAKQIKRSKQDNLNEIVYVLGKENYKFIKDLGYNAILVSEDNYNRKLSSDHTYIDFKNLNHKLWLFEKALQEHDEIIFLDWDCRLKKPLDDNFYNLIKNGGELQVPLYIYPQNSLDWLCETLSPKDFFLTLKKNVIKYSYNWKNHYIIPNTGFMYCRNKNINLLDKSLNLKLEAVPDEFSVFVYAQEKNYSLLKYIQNLEPQVILGKEHGEDWWIQIQSEFDKFVNQFKNKDIYFEHF